MRKIIRFFQKSGKDSEEGNAATTPLSSSQISNLIGPEGNDNSGQIVSTTAIHVGRKRENNEDALLSFSGTLAQNGQNQTFGFYAVADGMGGHQNGELASENALRALGDYVMSKLYHPLFGPNPKSPQKSLREIMEKGFYEAHLQVQRSAPGGGCTLTAALVFGSQMVIAHLGDSRAYSVYKDGRIKALTTDHTLVRRLVELGEITQEEAMVHPHKSVLVRALGQGQRVEADIFTGIMPQQGYLLLCTDGLWGVLSDKHIQSIINSAPNSNTAGKLLVEATNKAGGPDNIALIIVQLLN